MLYRFQAGPGETPFVRITAGLICGEIDVNSELLLVLDQASIGARVQELGEQISKDLAGTNPVVICVLRGALVFTADLVRSMQVPVTLDFVHASSYGLGTRSCRQVTIKKDIETDIAGRHVLLVDCIVDTGETLDHLIRRYQAMSPASIRTAVLLDKAACRLAKVHLDYVGFVIPDRFLVGYGIDSGEQYRNLPYLAAVRTGG